MAEEELQRELSNAGTDKFSDDEPIVFPVEGYRESICESSKAKFKDFEDEDAMTRTAAPPVKKDTRPVKLGGTSAKSKTCTVQ